AAQAASSQQLATLLPGDMRPAPKAQQPAQSGCAGTAPQTVSLSRDVAKALSLPEECGLKPKQAFRECQNCPDMVVIPAGEFMMGSPSAEIDSGLAAANESPQHKVAVKETLAIGRFEVTRDQFAAFVASAGYTPASRCFTFEQNL